MSQYLETYDERESLGKQWLASIGVHVAVFAMIAFSGFNLHKRNDWGSQNVGGGAVGISVVHSIPLPARPGLVNPLANDSNTTVPLPPPKAKPTPKAQEPEPDSIPLKSRKAEKKPSESASPKTTYRAPGRDAPNQLYSEKGPALASPMIQQIGSGGGIGIGQGSTLGVRFGWYIDLLRTKVGQHWNPDAAQQSNQPAVITFTLNKDGSVRDVRLAQRSGNTMLDFAAQRAIADAAPFQPMPDGAGNSANIEFSFNVRR
jgi:TonB family protein